MAPRQIQGDSTRPPPEHDEANSTDDCQAFQELAQSLAVNDGVKHVSPIRQARLGGPVDSHREDDAFLMRLGPILTAL